MITQKRLKEVLYYDPVSGIFIWKIGQKTGKIAGGLNSLGYRRIAVGSDLFCASRLAWFYETGTWPEGEIDHINHNRDDNRFSNLGVATRSENCYNKQLMSNNTSGYKGVSWRDRTKRWQAIITVNKKQKHLGYFLDKEDAIKAREIAEQMYHGVFALKNGV